MPDGSADLRPASGPGGPNGPAGGGLNGAAGGGLNGPVGGSPDGSDGSNGSAKDKGSAKETASLKESLKPTDIAAGAGASVVSAILGSFLGAVGTVLGAALGSIIYTLVSAFLTRGIEHSRDKALELKEKAAAKKGKGVAEGTAAAAKEFSGRGSGRPTGEETVVLDASRAGRTAAGSGPASGRGGPRRLRFTRKTVIVSAVLGLVTFGVSMFLITGIEVVKGSSLAGNGSGTSIGSVVRGGPPAEPTDQGEESSGTDSSSTSESATSTSESETGASESPTSTESGDSGQSEQPGSGSESGSGSDSDSDSGGPLGDSLNRVLPTQEPGSGQLQSGPDSGESGSAN